MRLLPKTLLTSLLLLPATLLGGPIYGTIRDGPNPLRSTAIEIACPDFAHPSSRVTSKTDDSGSFRVNVERQGRCMLRIPGATEIGVYSSEKPLRYNLEVVPGKAGRELRRR